MTLGFNINRRQPRTNLPGVVGSSVVSVERLVVRARPSPSLEKKRRPKPTAAAPATLPALATAVSTAVSPALPPAASDVVAAAPQWVYATALRDLCDVDDGAVVCARDERCMLVYPMEASKDDSGTVRMRLKRAHPVTGQLAHHWVPVYDPNHDERFVGAFSVVA